MAEPKARSSREQARRRSRIRTGVVCLAVVAVLAVAGTAWARSRSAAPVYRLASVSRANLTQTVDADSTIATVHQSTLTFGTSGTLTSVAVRNGDSVRAGQIVARLDPTDLIAAVVSAKQTLATAKQTLATDEDAETSTASTTAAVSGSAARTKIVLTATVRTISTTSTSAAIKAVKAAQKRLTAAQAQLDADIVAEKTAVNNAVNSGCKVNGVTTTVRVSATADSSGTVSGTVTGFATDTSVTATLLDSNGSTLATQTVPANGSYSFTGLTAGAGYTVQLAGTVSAIDTTTCQTALREIKSAQTAVDTDKSTVQAAITQLNTAISALEQAASSSSSSSPSQPTGGSSSAPGQPSSAQPSSAQPSSAQPSGAQPSASPSSGGGYPSGGTSASPSGQQSGAQQSQSGGTQSGSGSTGSSTTETITAQQIVADQKAIDSARAALRIAKQNRKLAVLRASMSGTVADLAVSAGDSVSTSDDVLTIVGRGRKAVTVNVSLAKIDLVKAGESARITVDGHPAALTGKVTQVGLTNTSSSTGSSSTYAVTIVLDPTSVRLYDGMGATVSIDVGTATSALSVPTSAVTTTGSMSTVRVYAGGKVSVTRVTLGVRGDSRVQVKSGLTAGQQVVLADVSAAVPSESNSGNTGPGGGSGLTTGLGGSNSVRFGGGPPGN